MRDTILTYFIFAYHLLWIRTTFSYTYIFIHAAGVIWSQGLDLNQHHPKYGLSYAILHHPAILGARAGFEPANSSL